MEIWQLSALEIAAAIRAGQFSSREALDAHIERIEKINPVVNAITDVILEAAQKAANAADSALAKGDISGPLHGVPISVKENIDVAGSATTQGVVALKDAIATQDSPQIANLRAAGAIPFARTNMPDFGLRWYTDNALRGATLNPWNPDLTPGGSSGGEAVALATGMTPLGCGNDLGGSLRIPSAFAGTAAIKPTTGRVPFASCFDAPPPPLTIHLFAVEGPMARQVDDLVLALEVMSRGSVRDPLWVPARKDPSDHTPKRVAVCRAPGGLTLHPDVMAGIDKAAEALADAGYRVEDQEPPELENTEVAWLNLLMADINLGLRPAMGPLLSQGATAFLDLINTWGPEPSLESYMRWTAERHRLAAAWRAFHADYPIILGPVCNNPPFEIGADIESPERNEAITHSLNLTTSVNMLGLPAAVVPVGKANGLPQAVQLIADRFCEQTALTAARSIEARTDRLTPITP